MNSKMIESTIIGIEGNLKINLRAIVQDDGLSVDEKQVLFFKTDLAYSKAFRSCQKRRSRIHSRRF